MFKKNSWIVALILALAVTALFTGCIDALEPSTEPTYTEVELGEMNAWGGQPYQRGWSVAGLVFDAGGVNLVAADKGYKNEDFAKATKLVIEVTEGHPNGNLDMSWSGELEDGTPYPSGWELKGGIAHTKSGNTVTIDLTDLRNYDKYVESKIARRRLIIQTGGDANPATWVTKAKLLIPDIPQVVPPNPMAIPGNGKYDFEQITVSDPDNILVDLNKSVIGILTPGGHFPDASITATALTATFNWNLQNIFIEFDDYVGPLIRNAAAGGYKFGVTIKGSATTTARYRVAMGHDSTSGWNVSNLYAGDFNAIASTSGITTEFTLSASAADLKGIVIQLQPTANNSDNVAVTASTMTITSIQIQLIAPTSLTAIPSFAITIPQPVAGKAPEGNQKSVSGKVGTDTNDAWTGAVTWSPALPSDGKFATGTVYRAKVAITAKPGYYIQVPPTTVTVTGPVTGSTAAFDLSNFAVVSGAFAPTEPKIPLEPIGVFFILDKDFTDGVAAFSNKWWESYPLQYSEWGDRENIVVDDSGDPDVVISTIPTRAQDYHGFELFFGTSSITWSSPPRVSMDLDPSIYKIKITVEGSIQGTVAAGTKFLAVGAGADEHGTGDKLIEEALTGDEDEEFSFSATMPKTFDFKESDSNKAKQRLRFLLSGGEKTGYNISKLEVEILGYW